MEKATDVNKVIELVINYMKKVGYSETRIAQHKSAWKRLIDFMIIKNLILFTATVADSFIYNLLSNRNYDQISRWEKDIIMCVNRLIEYMETGVVKYRRSKMFYELHGPIGKTMQDYLRYKRDSGIQQETRDGFSRVFQAFLDYLNNHKILDLKEINRDIIIDYTVFSNGFQTQYIRHKMLNVLKAYFRYLYDNQILEIDFSKTIPKDKFVKQPKLPSTYTVEEVKNLLKAIDRGSPKGKRDYAMVLITANLGLRASDVCGLKFENIHWEHNTIFLTMKKTDNQIQLPLLTEVGEAIIDYLKYGRPESELPFIFLHVNHPYDQLNRATLHSIICQNLRRANIDYSDGRSHGPHALRHSLAGLLLEKHTPIPVIAAVLGHSSIESTRNYVRIDISSLRQCALDVPLVPQMFYEYGGI